MKEVTSEEGRALALTHAEWQAEAERIKGWEKQTGTHRCAICHSGLVVRWNPEKNRMELACSQDKAHEGIEPYSDSKERLRRFRMDDTRLAKAPDRSLVAELQARWPRDLQGSQAVAFAKLCLEYGFDPILGEIVPYQGRPYITFDGTVRRASQHKDWGGWSELRPATTEEKAARGYAPDDYVAVAQSIRKGVKNPLTFGRVTQAEIEKQRKTEMERHGSIRAPLVLSPYDMAEKRAMHKDLRRNFSDAIKSPFVGLEEAGTEEDISVKVIDVDPSTGEILGGDAPPEATASPQPQQGASASKDGPQAVQEAPPPLAAATQAQAGPPQGKVMTPTEFWTEARKLGYEDATKTEQVLGATVPQWIRGGGTYRTALIALQAAKGQAQQ